MKISTKRKDALYLAISETITDERIQIAKYAKNRDGKIAEDVIDRELCSLECRIWAKVSAALGIVDV